MTDNTQPEAGSTHIIRYALELGLLWIDGDGRDKVREALDALDTLEAQLEAIGAGGVSGPLIGRAALSANAGEPVAWTSGSWVGASTWLRNNYQDYPNIASLCDAMLEAAPQPAPDCHHRPPCDECAAPAAQGGTPQPTPLSDDVVRDAARYRWLRATTNYVTSNGKRIDVRNTPEKWDAAIDAAIAAQKGK